MTDISSVDDAVKKVAAMLDPPEGTQAPATEPTNTQPESEQPLEDSPEPDSEVQEPVSETTTEETTETSEEPSYTLEDFAQAVEMDKDQFLEAITVPVRVDGEDAQVTLKDLSKGHIREASYTKRMQELADERRSLGQRFEGELEALKTKSTRLDDAIATIEAQIEHGPTNEQLAQLAQQDPAQYVSLMEAQRVRKDALQAAKREREEAQRETHNKQAQQLQEWQLDQARQLADRWEDFRDPTKGAQREGEIKS